MTHLDLIVVRAPATRLRAQLRHGLLTLLLLIFACVGSAGAQMYTKADFKVSPAGAATYSIPIKVAPGINGLEPKLSIVYNSQGPNGSMGMGFSLSGLSAITRCPQTPASDTPPNRRGVKLDLEDRFCLDGQRLILVSGTYGADGSEYRTEMESYSKITARSQQGNGPMYFEVKTKTGLTVNYGGWEQDDNGRMEAADSPTVIFWGVKYINDLKGQVMHVGYYKDTANRQLRPINVVYAYDGWWKAWVSIDYELRPDPTESYLGATKIVQAYRVSAIHNTVGVLGTTHNLVRSYIINYGAVGPTTGRSRVASIQECGPSGACLPATTFAWPGGSVGTLATQVQTTWVPSGPGYWGWSGMLHDFQPGDFDADGRSDLYALRSYPQMSDGENTTPPWVNGTFCKPPWGGCNSVDLSSILATYQVPEYPPDPENGPTVWIPEIAEFHVGDANGDGYTDIVIVTKANQGCPDPEICQPYTYPHSIRYWYCAGPGITTANNCVLLHALIELNLPYTETPPLATFADFDGDRRSDLMVHVPNQSHVAYCPGTSGGLGSCSSVSSNLPAPPQYPAYLSNVVRLGDFDGDGKADLYVMTPTSGAWFCAGNGAATTGSCVQNHSTNWTDLRAYPGDYNGDGITDLYLISNAQSGSTLSYLCQGTSLTKANTVNCQTNTLNGDWRQFSVFPGDYNGDGKTDLLMIQGNIYTGANQGYYCSGLTPDCTPISGNWWQAWGMVYPADYHGRGVTDILLNYAGQSSYLTTITRVTGSYDLAIPDLLQSATTGLGATISLTYRPITTNGPAPEYGVYWKEGIPQPYGLPVPPFSVDLNPELRPPMYVVQDESHSNGLGGTNGFRHHYSGARFNRDGRGFLGYSWHQVDNWSAYNNTRTYFRQDYPFTGQPFTTWAVLYDANWTNARQIVETNAHYRALEYSGGSVTTCGLDTTACSPAGGKRYFPFPYIGDNVPRDPDTGTQLYIARDVQWSYDEYGNLLTSSNYRYDMNWNYLGYETTVNNDYWNDPGKWILGRVLRSRVYKACGGADPTLCN